MKWEDLNQFNWWEMGRHGQSDMGVKRGEPTYQGKVGNGMYIYVYIITFINAL